MTPARRLLAVAAVATLGATGLAGCQLIEPNDSITQTASATGACVAAHEWDLDPATLATSTKDDLADHGITAKVSVDGTESLVYVESGALTVISDFTITATNTKTDVTATRTVKGTSAGQAYFNDTVMIPRGWDEKGLQVTDAQTDANGKPVAKITWRLPHSWIDDTVGLTTGCSDDTLTLAARGTQKAWTYLAPGSTPAP